MNRTESKKKSTHSKKKYNVSTLAFETLYAYNLQLNF